MLNDADGHGGGEASEVLKDADALYRRLKRDVKADYNSKGQVN
jgi:serine/threonine protein phosphatase PrpC